MSVTHHRSVAAGWPTLMSHSKVVILPAVAVLSWSGDMMTGAFPTATGDNKHH